jgi:hypothetical protein
MPLIPTYDASLFPMDLTKNPSQLTPTAFPSGLMGSGEFTLQLAYQLTSAQLLALQTTAVQLAPAPGLLFALMPKFMSVQYKFGGTAYTIGNADNAFQIEYTGKATNLLKTNATGLVDQASDQVIDVAITDVGSVISRANRENLGLEVKLVGTTPALTLGNGTVVLNLNYDVLKLV